MGDNRGTGAREQHIHGVERGDDVDLVVMARDGDERATGEIFRRYRALIRSKSRFYFLNGADREDIIQEGLIGLYKAIRDYDPEREAGFRSFAELCITRQIISAVKASTRLKHSPMSGYVSLSRTTSGDEEGERLFSDILAVKDICDPAAIVMGAWETEFISTGLIDALSEFERDVLRLYMHGEPYSRIAVRLSRTPKAVDNALQRIRRKMETQIHLCHMC